MAFTTHTHLAPRLKKEYSHTVVPPIICYRHFQRYVVLMEDGDSTTTMEQVGNVTFGDITRGDT